MTSQPHLNQSNHEENLRLSVKSYPSLLHDTATPFYFSKISHYFCETIDACGGPMHAWIMWCAYRLMLSPNFCLFISQIKDKSLS